MEVLNIKCPACGIILEVKNSKHEAVKRITCPYCKKTLAITFHSEEEPEQKKELAALPVLYYNQMRLALQEGQNQIPLPDADCLAVRVVRLKDGNCKCLVSAKREQAVRLNDELLALGDEVALSDGDLLRFGQTLLSFNRPVEAESMKDPQPKPIPRKKKPSWWLAVVACIAAIALLAVLWPSEKETVTDNPTVENLDTLLKRIDKPTTVEKGKKTDGRTKEPHQTIDYTKLTDYELGLLSKTDVNAQYELGRRRVKPDEKENIDSIDIVIGANYLKLASSNGHKEAGRALQSVRSTLRKAANDGNTHAANLLKVINGEQ